MRTLPTLALLGLATMACSPGVANGAAAFDRTHSLFEALLGEHVADGRVDYARLRGNPQPLDAYLATLASLSPAGLKALPRSDQLAYWINAYNAFVLKSVTEHYPLRRGGIVGLAFPANSIWQISGVWKDRRWPTAGGLVSLDQIEHEIIRPTFKDARTHFALVCASTSCPDLIAQAYRGEIIERQLTEQTRRFLHDPDKGVRLDAASGAVWVSKIFDWFEEDFEISGVLGFIAAHRPETESRSLLQRPGIDMKFLPYDWTLNDRERR